MKMSDDCSNLEYLQFECSYTSVKGSDRLLLWFKYKTVWPSFMFGLSKVQTRYDKNTECLTFMNNKH